MKNSKLAAVLIIISLSVSIVGCSRSDMATVTIDSGLRNHSLSQKPGILDRLIALISLGSIAQADPPVDLSFSLINLTISGPDMETVAAQIPMDTGIATLQIPAGNSRFFKVKAHGSGATQDYSGSEIVNLNAGEVRAISISMREAVYVGGYYGESVTTPCYWKNGIRQDLTGSDGKVFSITLSDHIPYCAGSYDAGNIRACYWINTVFQDVLNDGVANAIEVEGGHIYIGGNTFNIGGYWVDNEAGFVMLTPAATGNVRSLKVNNTTVHSTGVHSGTAKYWSGTTGTLLTGSGVIPYSLFIEGSDVYICGDEGTHAIYYRNGVKHDLELSFTSHSRSIFVRNGNVYVGGYYYPGSQSKACYWINGTRIDMPDVPDLEGIAETYANGIVVDENDVYMSGYAFDDMSGYSSEGCYWKNSTRHILTGTASMATSICFDK